MRSLIINGGAEISGNVTIGGNKNAVLPMIAASILTKEEIIMHDVPAISDADVMLKIIQHLGAKVTRSGKTVRINAKNITKSEIPKSLCSALRTSILLAGPLSVRCGEATIYPPGGDVIGAAVSTRISMG